MRWFLFWIIPGMWRLGAHSSSVCFPAQASAGICHSVKDFLYAEIQRDSASLNLHSWYRCSLWAHLAALHSLEVSRPTCFSSGMGPSTSHGGSVQLTWALTVHTSIASCRVVIVRDMLKYRVCSRLSLSAPAYLPAQSWQNQNRLQQAVRERWLILMGYVLQ